MNTPAKGFWLMARNLNRIIAESDLRSLDLSLTATGGDQNSVRAVRDSLIKEIDFEVDDRPLEEEVDEDGLNELRYLGRF